MNITNNLNSKTFAVQFNSTGNTFSNVGFNKISNTFSPSTGIKPTSEEIYYDEVIYYDGGDVKGYGSE